MQRLPAWAFQATRPAFPDVQSVTAQEAVAYLHGAMNELIDEYNAFATALQKEVTDFQGGTSKEVDDFKKSMEQRLACKFKEVDQKTAAIKTELTKFATDWLEKNAPDSLPMVTAADNGKLLMAQNGKWVPVTPDFTYDPATETLTLNILGGA